MNLKHILAASLLLFFPILPVVAQENSKPPVVLLWPEGAPLAQGSAEADVPRLTLYLPKGSASKTAVVVLPGGSYHVLASDHEGKQPAQWLNSLGISAFVLEYRLGPKYHFPVPLLDAQRAIRYVRANAQKFGIDPNRVGVWGFSAGGHLASLTGTHFESANPAAPDAIDRFSARPDFLILSYPVIRPLGKAAEGSFKNLLGETPSAELVRSVSTDLQVTAQTPPTFLQHSSDDDAVLPENSIRFYEALQKSGVPSELHIFQSGGHGYGLAPLDAVLGTWVQRLADWLRVQKLLDQR